MIGTKFFPKFATKHILLLEDVNEHPARLMRFLFQWQESGALENIAAIILGGFLYSDENYKNYSSLFKERCARNLEIPVLSSEEFGHCADSCGFLIGSHGVIKENKLVFEAVNPLV